MEAKNKRRLGSAYEQMAADYLTSLGFQLLEKNYRCRFGEIDLILKEENVLVFTEVKYRRTSGAGDAAEAVHQRKQRTISRVADYYLCTHYASIPACRFDVLAIDGSNITLYRNAFFYVPVS